MDHNRKKGQQYAIGGIRTALLFLLSSSFLYLAAERIPFSFTKKPLQDILDMLAERKKFNIIYPAQPDALEAFKKQTISFTPPKKTTRTVEEAWNLLQTWMELSGFSLIRRQENQYEVIKNNPTIGVVPAREVLPLFTSTDIPDSDERIRAVYYLKNLKVPTLQEKEQHPLAKMLKEHSQKMLQSFLIALRMRSLSQIEPHSYDQFSLF